MCGGGKGQTGPLKTHLKTSHSLDRKEVGGNISDSLCLCVCVCQEGWGAMMSFLNVFQLSPVTSSDLGAEMWLKVWGP